MNLASTLRRKSDIRYRIIDGEAVIIRQSAAEVLLVNPVGARILELIDAGISVQELLDRLAEEFDVDRSVLNQDAAQFIDALVNAGVLEQVPSAPPSPS